MMTTEQNEAAARRCIDLFNKRTLEWVETCYAPDVEWIELPLPTTPAGQHGDRAFLSQVAQRMLTLFPDRQIEILNLVPRRPGGARIGLAGHCRCDRWQPQVWLIDSVTSGYISYIF